MRLTVGRKTAKSLAVGRRINKKKSVIKPQKKIKRKTKYGNVQGLVWRLMHLEFDVFTSLCRGSEWVLARERIGGREGVGIMRDSKGWEWANWHKSQNLGRGVRPIFFLFRTVEPRYGKTRYNEVLDITNDIFCPSYSIMYGKEPRYNQTSF